MTTQEKNAENVKLLVETVDWNNIDNLINTNQCKISLLSKDLKCKPNDLRSAFEEHYKDQIVFKRGRNGGVFWKQDGNKDGE